MPRHLQRGASTAAPLMVSYRLSRLNRYARIEGRWLDCGCADGGYTHELVNWGAQRAVGIDVEKDRVASARELFSDREELDFICARSEAMPFPKESFDGVFMNEVLEHVDDESETLREAWRVLRDGGWLALMSPNRLFPFEGHGLRITDRVRLAFPVPLVPWLPRRTTDRFVEARNYWPWELRGLVARHGFAVVHSSSVLPVFETVRWLPGRLIDLYRKNLRRTEVLPLIRHFGVSTLIVATKTPSAELPV